MEKYNSRLFTHQPAGKQLALLIAHHGSRTASCQDLDAAFHFAPAKSTEVNYQFPEPPGSNRPRNANDFRRANPLGFSVMPTAGKQPAPALGDALKRSALGRGCKAALFTKTPARAAVRPAGKIPFLLILQPRAVALSPKGQCKTGTNPSGSQAAVWQGCSPQPVSEPVGQCRHLLRI